MTPFYELDDSDLTTNSTANYLTRVCAVAFLGLFTVLEYIHIVDTVSLKANLFFYLELLTLSVSRLSLIRY